MLTFFPLDTPSDFHPLPISLTNDPLELLHDGFVDAGLLPDHGVVLVVGVVGVAKFAIGTKFKLEKLVTEFALVSDVVAQVEIALHLVGNAVAKEYLLSFDVGKNS